MYCIRLPHELTEVKRKFTLLFVIATFIPTEMPHSRMLNNQGHPANNWREETCLLPWETAPAAQTNKQQQNAAKCKFRLPYFKIYILDQLFLV